MWVQRYKSDVQPSRHELHEQFIMPTTSSRRVVVHHVGDSMKSETSVDMAGSTYSGTKNSNDAPAVTEKNANVDVA